MRALVTGGAGFIGSHLVEHLLGQGHEVTVIDNLVTGRKRNLEFASGRAVRLVESDINDAVVISPHFENVDWVFHLGALADIVPSIENPLEYMRANVSGTSVVLEAARRSGVKRFIYAASSSCYGLPSQFPTPETEPVKPQYPYALSKYLGELSVLHWGQVYGLPVLSFRFFNVYGPRARTSGTYGAVLGVFLRQKLAGEPLTIVGDGSQTRDFTFVTDVVTALVAGAQSSLSGEVFNVGSGGTYSVNHLARLLGGPTVHIPRRPGEPDCTYADISKIRRLLDWHPSVSFEEGVERVQQSISDWSDAPLWTPASIEVATRDWFRYLDR